MDDATLIAPEALDRRTYIGGSDIAACLGISPWRSPYELWADKTEGSQRRDSPALRRGIRWESVVAEMVVEDLQARGHSVEVVGTNRRHRDPEVSFFAAEIDFEIRIDGESEPTNVELKTVHPFKIKEWGDTGSDSLPVHYLAQVLWGLGITRRRKGFLAALFGADELRTYPVAADQETIEAMRKTAHAFWHEFVLAQVAPPARTLSDVERMFRTEGEAPPLMADDSLTESLLRMRACKQEIDARTSELEVLEFQIKRAMRDAAEIVLPNGKAACEWKTRSGSWFDESAFKEAHPKLAKEFARKWEKRVFRFKAFDTKGIE
jgi:putative phage-type endonuclease